MLGKVVQSTGKIKPEHYEEESVIKGKIQDLQKSIEDINKALNDLKDDFTTTNLTSDNANITAINSTQVDASSAIINQLNSLEVSTNQIIASLAKITTLRTDLVDAKELKGQLRSVQDSLTITSALIPTLKSTNIEATKVVTTELQTTLLTLSSLITASLSATSAVFGSLDSNSAEIDVLKNKKLTTDEITTDTIVASELNSPVIDTVSLNATQVETVLNKADITESPTIVGKLQLNLDPQLATEDSYYVLKIKKGFDMFSLGIRDSFDCKIIQSFYGDSKATNGAFLVALHQKDLNEVFLLSTDKDYVYLQISPDVVNEIEYRYTSREKITDVITFTVNEKIDYDFYYNPMKTSEIIMLGNTNGHDADSYQFTVLGKLWATLSPDFEDMMFDSIHIAHDIHVKDYFDETTGVWVYKRGSDNQYLNTINEEWDEVLEQWITRIEWKSPVDTTTISPIQLTEDSQEDVYVINDEGEEVLVGKRNTYGTSKRLLTTETVANWNGKVTTEEGEPVAETITTEITDSARPCDVLLGFLNINDCIDYNKGALCDFDLELPRSSTKETVNVKKGDIVTGGMNVLIVNDVQYPLIAGTYTLTKYVEQPASEYNPIIKLGIVDEGSVEYGAGFIHTEELGVKNDINWKTSEAKDAKDYNVWLDGDIPTKDDLDWVRR